MPRDENWVPETELDNVDIWLPSGVKGKKRHKSIKLVVIVKRDKNDDGAWYGWKTRIMPLTLRGSNRYS